MMETAFSSLVSMVEEREARESLLRFQAGAGLPEDDALFVLAYALALAVRVPNDETMDKGRSLADSCGTLAVRLERLEGGLKAQKDGIVYHQDRLAKAGDAIVQALEPLVANLNGCANAVRAISNDNAETLKRWNEAMTAIQRAERDIVAAAVGTARAEATKGRLGTAKIAAVAGVAASVVGGPVGVLILKIFGAI